MDLSTPMTDATIAAVKRAAARGAGLMRISPAHVRLIHWRGLENRISDWAGDAGWFVMFDEQSDGTRTVEWRERDARMGTRIERNTP